MQRKFTFDLKRNAITQIHQSLRLFRKLEGHKVCNIPMCLHLSIGNHRHP